MGAYYRLETEMPASAVADHYVQQLTALGWKPKLTQNQLSFALVRFSGQSPSGPFIGILTVVPTTVTRVEELMRGGSQDSSHAETRLDTFDSPAALMKIIEPQFAARGWMVDGRAGDAVQAITKFSPLVAGDSTALLMLTSLPGTREVSLILNVVRNRP
jgi:hypothetical protein